MTFVNSQPYLIYFCNEIYIRFLILVHCALKIYLNQTLLNLRKTKITRLLKLICDTCMGIVYISVCASLNNTVQIFKMYGIRTSQCL